MSKYQNPPSWWKMVQIIRELCGVLKMWDSGQITHESGMRAISTILKEYRSL